MAALTSPMGPPAVCRVQLNRGGASGAFPTRKFPVSCRAAGVAARFGGAGEGAHHTPSNDPAMLSPGLHAVTNVSVQLGHWVVLNSCCADRWGRKKYLDWAQLTVSAGHSEALLQCNLGRSVSVARRSCHVLPSLSTMYNHSGLKAAIWS